MQLFYTVKFLVEIEESELDGDKPKDFIEKRIEEDPGWLFEDSDILGHSIVKVIKDEVEEDDTDEDDDDDDDDLTEIEEEDMF